MENRDLVIQQRLRPETGEIYHVFPIGTVVWPERSRRGVLTEDLQAEKLDGKKVRDFQAWKAEGVVRLYLDRRYRQLSSGTLFGAPENSARTRTIKNK